MGKLHPAYWSLVVFWAEWLVLLGILWKVSGFEIFKNWLILWSKVLTPALYVMYLMDYKIHASRKMAERSVDGFYLWAAHLSVKQWELMAFKLIPIMTIIIVSMILLPFACREIYRRLITPYIRGRLMKRIFPEGPSRVDPVS